jgi:hypothetical protein
MPTIDSVEEIEVQPLMQRNVAVHVPTTLSTQAITTRQVVKKILALSGSCISIVAVLPVPYLVARSVYYLLTKEERFTFAEMIRTNKLEFWLLGPATAGLATIAIAPFNAYNTYKTIANCELDQRCLSLGRLISGLGGLLFLSSGMVNGYNMNYLCNDVIPYDSLAKRIAQYSLVSIGILFAGISEGRATLSYLQQDVPYRLRYVKRGINCSVSGIGLFRMSNQQPARKQLLAKLQAKLDDVKTICLLGLTDTELMQYAHLIDELKQVDTLARPALIELLAMSKKPFPSIRFACSEIIGTGLAGGLAYLGNQNVLNYAHEALVEFEHFCGLADDNILLQIINFVLPKLGYTVGFMLSLFLIQDLFFRDVLKATTGKEFLQRFFKLIIPLFPAFSFGLLNVILTALNTHLSPMEKTLVSLAAIIGATVVSRYGIEGGIEEVLGRGNPRRELANLTTSVMEKLQRWDRGQLLELERCLEETSGHSSVYEQPQHYQSV